MKKVIGALSFVLCFHLIVGAATLEPGDFVTSGPKSGKMVALTFDDGPGPHTQKFIDLLDKHDIKATFFMQGDQVVRRPEVAAMVAKAGHEIAGHGWNHTNFKKRHKDLKKTESTDKEALAKVKNELVNDFRRTKMAIEEATSKKIELLRMPHGIDRPWIKEVAQEEGLILVNWTFGSDWQRIPYQELEEMYVEAIRPGAIFLFHDGGGKRDVSLKLTAALIEELKKKGYEIVTVGHLVGLNVKE